MDSPLTSANNEFAEEIDLLDIARTLYNGKWLIIFGTLVCIIFAYAICRFIKPVYKMVALLEPPKIVSIERSGRKTEIYLIDSKKTILSINNGVYNAEIGKVLGLKKFGLQSLRSRVIKKSAFIELEFKTSEPKVGIKILNVLISILKRDTNFVVKNAVSKFEEQISYYKNKKNHTKKMIEILKKNVSLIEKKKKGFFYEMNKLIKVSRQLQFDIKKMNSFSDRYMPVQILMKLTSLSVAINYFLADKINFFNINLQKSILEQLNNLNAIELKIKSLNLQKEKIYSMKVIKQPEVLPEPIYPKTKLVLSVTVVMALALFSFISFFKYSKPE